MLIKIIDYLLINIISLIMFWITQAVAMDGKDIVESKPTPHFSMIFPELKQEIFKFVTKQHKKCPPLLIQGARERQDLDNLGLVSHEFYHQTKALREQAKVHQYIAGVQSRAERILDKMAHRQDIYDYLLFPGNDKFFTDDVLITIEQEIGQQKSRFWRPLSYLNLVNYPLLTDDGIALIGKMWDIIVLSCTNCPGIQGMSLQNFGILQQLTLENCCSLTDEGLSSLIHVNTLNALTLTNCPNVTNDGLKFISEMEYPLQLLSINNCPKITENMLLDLSMQHRTIFITLNNSAFHLGRKRNSPDGRQNNYDVRCQIF